MFIQLLFQHVHSIGFLIIVVLTIPLAVYIHPFSYFIVHKFYYLSIWDSAARQLEKEHWFIMAGEMASGEVRYCLLRLICAIRFYTASLITCFRLAFDSWMEFAWECNENV